MASLPDPAPRSPPPCPRAVELPYWGPILFGLLAVPVAMNRTAGWSVSSKFALGAWLLYATVVAYWAIVIVWRQLPARDLLGAWPSRADARLLVGATLGYLGVVFGWWSIMDHMGWVPELPEEPPNAAYVILTVVLAPPVEEVLFRGILLPRLASRVGPIASALLSSAIFAALHFDAAGSFLFSLVMVCLYVRTQSLWVPTVAHSLGNFLVPALDEAGLLAPMFARKWVVVGAVAVSLPWLAVFFCRGLRDFRIPGFIETANARLRREGAEQTASAAAAAPGPEPETTVIADEPKVDDERQQA